MPYKEGRKTPTATSGLDNGITYQRVNEQEQNLAKWVGSVLFFHYSSGRGAVVTNQQSARTSPVRSTEKMFVV